MPCNTLISEKGTVERREGTGNPPGKGPAHRAPLCGCYGNRHNRNKTEAVAWQQKSKVCHTLHIHIREAPRE